MVLPVQRDLQDQMGPMDLPDQWVPFPRHLFRPILLDRQDQRVLEHLQDPERPVDRQDPEHPVDRKDLEVLEDQQLPANLVDLALPEHRLHPCHLEDRWVQMGLANLEFPQVLAGLQYLQVLGFPLDLVARKDRSFLGLLVVPAHLAVRANQESLDLRTYQLDQMHPMRPQFRMFQKCRLYP